MASEAVIDFDRLPPHLHPQVPRDLRQFLIDPATGCLYSSISNMQNDPKSRSARFRIAEAKRAINRELRTTARPT